MPQSDDRGGSPSMGTIRLPICVAIMLLAVPQGGQAQDTFNSNSGAVPNMGAGQALRCAEERLKHYADEPFKQPSVCPQPTPSDATPGTSGGVLLKGGVEENGKRPGAAGIFEGGTLPPRTEAGVFGPKGEKLAVGCG
jgi:hypothetical protein